MPIRIHENQNKKLAKQWWFNACCPYRYHLHKRDADYDVRTRLLVCIRRDFTVDLDQRVVHYASCGERTASKILRRIPKPRVECRQWAL
jgi:hypothetical protein